MILGSGRGIDKWDCRTRYLHAEEFKPQETSCTSPYRGLARRYQT